MTIYITGDTHGQVIERFSYRQHPDLRNLTTEDFMFILGDFGQPFGKAFYKQAQNTFRFLNDKPWTTIVIGGNHDDYDYWESCPQVSLCGGIARQATFDNETYSVFFIDHITIFNINDEHILCIPKAESHDIWNLLDPEDENYKMQVRQLKRTGQFFRVKHVTWWPQEKMNVEENMNFMEQHEDEHFTIILSHDAPGKINDFFASDLSRLKSTEGERYLEMLRQHLNFDAWFHGHYHVDATWPSRYDDRISCVYYNILQV